MKTYKTDNNYMKTYKTDKNCTKTYKTDKNCTKLRKKMILYENLRLLKQRLLLYLARLDKVHHHEE